MRNFEKSRLGLHEGQVQPSLGCVNIWSASQKVAWVLQVFRSMPHWHFGEAAASELVSFCCLILLHMLLPQYLMMSSVIHRQCQPYVMTQYNVGHYFMILQVTNPT